MSDPSNKIECPNCGQDIDVNDILYHQVDEELRKKYQDELTREKAKVQERMSSLDQEKARLLEEKAQQAQTVAEAVQDGIKSREKELAASLKKKLADETAGQLTALQEELSEKSTQLKEFNKAKAEIERLKRDRDEQKEAIEAESEKKLTALLQEEKAKIQKAESEKARMSLKEKDQTIEQMRAQLAEAQRKAEQGSTQLQGEVQELAIEEWLAATFPLDSIEEIKKGARGADCLQVVHTRSRQNCGTIYYESKRTKDFHPGWIEKFKNDIRERNADIGVLVTEAMPAELERMGLKDGIWVCSFDEFKGLSVVLRESVIRLSRAVATQENKGEKMGMLYDFLTGNEFRLQVEAIVEGFTQMKTDLESEKRAMTGIWKKRDKQIEKVLLNTNHMYSSIKGIAGNAIKSVPALELPEGDAPETEFELE